MKAAHDHQTVAGKQLAAYKDDHHQTNRKDAAGYQSGQTHIGNCVHGNGTGRSTAGDEHTGENTQQDHAQER